MIKKTLITLFTLALIAVPAVSHASLGDILYGSTNPSINTRLPIGTNGKVLQSTGSIPSWVATSSLGLNIAPFFTATSTTATSTFAGAVGIGTTSPTKGFTAPVSFYLGSGTVSSSSPAQQNNSIVGDTSIDGILYLNRSSSCTGGGCASGQIYTTNNGMTIQAPLNSNSRIIFDNGSGVEQARFNGSGKFGVMTNSPNYTLEVNGIASSTTLYLSNPLGVAYGGTGQNTFTSSQLLYGNNQGNLLSVATTSAGCSGTVTCSGFSVIGSSPITI